MARTKKSKLTKEEWFRLAMGYDEWASRVRADSHSTDGWAFIPRDLYRVARPELADAGYSLGVPDDLKNDILIMVQCCLEMEGLV